MPSCLLCETELSGTNRAREHVFPRWLLEYFRVNVDELFQGKHLTFFGQAVETRVQGAHTIVQGRVCEPCNNGWMSELESAVQPLFLSMDEGYPLSILASGLQSLAAWTFKVLGLYNITMNFHTLITEQALHSFGRTHTPPPGYHIE